MNLALRQQLAVLAHTGRRGRVTGADRLFWVTLPLVLCMCVSTVYVRNHYVADVIGGMVTGTLGYVTGVWLMRKQEAVAARA